MWAIISEFVIVFSRTVCLHKNKKLIPQDKDKDTDSEYLSGIIYGKNAEREVHDCINFVNAWLIILNQKILSAMWNHMQAVVAWDILSFKKNIARWQSEIFLYSKWRPFFKMAATR